MSLRFNSDDGDFLRAMRIENPETDPELSSRETANALIKKERFVWDMLSPADRELAERWPEPDIASKLNIGSLDELLRSSPEYQAAKKSLDELLWMAESAATARADKRHQQADDIMRKTLKSVLDDADKLHAACERWIKQAHRSASLVKCQWWMLAVMGVAIIVLAWEVITK